MTSSPPGLIDTRNFLLSHLDFHPGKTVSVDLDPLEVGIVGDPAHRGGYHCGKDRVITNDYSVVESSHDRDGLCDYASALDVGLFTVTSNGKTHTLRTFSKWCVDQCVANAPDTHDIREIIYSLDGKTVKRWDRLKKRITGDSSHLIHTHFSLFRDATKAGRGLKPLFTRYLQSIGVINAERPEMDLNDKVPGTGYDGRTVENVLTDLENLRNALITPLGAKGVAAIAPAGSPLALLTTMAQAFPTASKQLTDLSTKDFTDEGAISHDVATQVIAALDPTSLATLIAQKLPANQAQQVVDELVARLSRPTATS